MDGGLGDEGPTFSRRQALGAAGGLMAGVTVGAATFSRQSRAQEAGSRQFPMFQGGPLMRGYVPNGAGPRDGFADRWSVQSRSRFHTLTTPVAANGMVHVVGQDGRVYTFDVASGEQRWAVDTGAAIQTSPAVGGGRLFVLTDGRLFGFDAASGEIIWEHEFRLPPDTSVYNRLTLAHGDLFSPSGGGFVVFDPATGEERWRYSARRTMSSVAASPTHVFFAEPDVGRLAALNRETRDEEWVAVFEDQSHWSGAPTVGEAAVYITTVGGEVYAFNIGDGEERWSTQLDTGITGSAVLTGDSVIVSTGQWDDETANGSVYALERTDGSTRWRYQHSAPLVASPIVVGETVYVGGGGDDRAGTVLALDLTDGSTLARRDFGLVQATFGVVDDVLLVPTDAGVLYAVEDGATGGDQPTESQVQTVEGDTERVMEPDAGVAPQRGFLSNTGDEPAFLGNVFNLTVLGFLLSIGGIIHQMIKE